MITKKPILSAVLIAVLFYSAPSLYAAPLSAGTKEELNQLLARLEKSGCQFNRNGSWYSGAEAKAHLQRKFDHVEKKTPAKTTEEFIDLAASKSSSSGEAYQVKCPDQAAVPSANWLLGQLKTLRAVAPGR